MIFIILGASSQSPLPHKASTPFSREFTVSPSPPNPSTSNDYKLSENDRTTDEIKECRTVARAPEPRSDPLMEAIEKAKRLHDVNRVLVISK
jgi:hypothetical protein